MKQPLEGERHQGEATRRDFLKGIAALGAGIVGPASLAACSPTGNDASKFPQQVRMELGMKRLMS
ncbi:MAG: twin-arginine translocation signal domain-containing protein [Adlercreutzia equolifaciens]